MQIEIKRVLESLYGFEVEKVQTLNMEGKKKKRGGLLIARPDYKKAYVTLKNSLSISTDLYPIRIIEEDKRTMSKQSKSSIVEEGEVKSHWLDGKDRGDFKAERSSIGGRAGARRATDGSARTGNGGRGRGGPRGSSDVSSGAAKFPWTSMRSSR